MNKFHDNIVFQIDEKYLTLLFKCHFCSSFLYCCIMFLPKVCDTELQKYTEVMRHAITGYQFAAVINHPPSCTKCAEPAVCHAKRCKVGIL